MLNCAKKAAWFLLLIECLIQHLDRLSSQRKNIMYGVALNVLLSIGIAKVFNVFYIIFPTTFSDR